MNKHHAGWPQSILLLLGSCLPVLGAVLIAPVLPKMQAHFTDNAMAAVLVPISLTLPALMIALFSPVAGLIADKLGRKRILLFSMLVYSLCGVLPIWLPTLENIVISRAGIGLAEAGIMTCCTTMIGDYFEGKRRERLFALQMVATSLSAAIFISVGGVLGQENWRTPFWLYASGLLFLPLMAWLLWEPVAKISAKVAHQGATTPVFATQRLPIPWKALAPLYFLTMVTGISLFLVPVQAGYLLNLISVDDPSNIGFTMGANQVGILLGAIGFQALARYSRNSILIAGLAITGIGSLLMSHANQYTLMTIAVSLSGLGVGLMMPTLITCIMSFVNLEQRGRVTGFFTAMLFLGEFISPLIVLSMTHGDTRQIPHALLVIAIGQLVISALIVIRIVKIQPSVAVQGHNL